VPALSDAVFIVLLVVLVTFGLLVQSGLLWLARHGEEAASHPRRRSIGALILGLASLVVTGVLLVASVSGGFDVLLLAGALLAAVVAVLNLRSWRHALTPPRGRGL